MLNFDYYDKLNEVEKQICDMCKDYGMNSDICCCDKCDIYLSVYPINGE